VLACRAGKQVSTGEHALQGGFAAGSVVTCSLVGLRDVGVISCLVLRVSVPIQGAGGASLAALQWKPLSVTVCKTPPGRDFETFYCGRWLSSCQEDGQSFVRVLASASAGGISHAAKPCGPHDVAVKAGVSGACSMRMSLQAAHMACARTLRTRKHLGSVC
jgi:hypothetical protein